MDAGLLPLDGKKFMIGTAYTVDTQDGDNFPIHAAIYQGKPGYVLVVAGKGYTERAYMGDLMGGAAEAIGLSGIVIDGYVRDKEGLFYTVSDGDVSLGTVNSGIMILFAVLYFSIMMNAGLFDPLCTFLIRKAKGDPLKVMMVTVLTSTVVTLDGDGTTTILIVTAAFLPLFKKMRMKLSNLAMMIILPCSIGNCLPWGGPLARAASVINVDVNVLFKSFLPVMIMGEIYIIILAWFLGKAERKRLGYVKGGAEIITVEQIEEMCRAVTENDRESKRPALFAFNAAFTIALMAAMIMGIASGAILFMLGTAVILAVNYNCKEQRERIAANGADTISVAAIIMAAGCFMGVLNGSGMADAMAASLAGMIPEAMGGHIPIIFAAVGAVACFALPVDAYYFGILPVIVPIAEKFGITGMEITMAALMGQAIRYGSPTVAWLFLLIDRTEMNFGEYLKTFMKYALPMFGVFTATALILGLFPV